MRSDASAASCRRDVERRGLGRLRPHPLQDAEEVRGGRLLHAQLGHRRRNRQCTIALSSSFMPVGQIDKLKLDN